MRELILIMNIIFLVQVSCKPVNETDAKQQQNNAFTIHQNIKTIDKNGTGIGYYLKYNIIKTNNPDLVKIKYRTDSIIRKIASLYTYAELINFNKRDSIDSRIISDILKTINFKTKKIDALNIKNIGIPKIYKEAYLLLENIEKDELNYIKNLKAIESMEGGFVSEQYDEIRETFQSSLTINTKYNSNLDIDLIVCKRKQQGSSVSINEAVKDIIKDSLLQFSMYEMWSTKLDTIQIIVENIIKLHDPEIRWVEVYVNIPEEDDK